MKLLIATLTLFSAFANASQFPFERSGLLPVRNLDANHFEYMNLEHASISIDGLNTNVSLYLSGTSKVVPAHCLVGDTRPSCVTHVDYTIDLPVVKVIQHACSRTIVAMKDMRPVDGIKETIIVNEQVPAPNVRCTKVHVKNATKVEYRTVGYDRFQRTEVRGTSKFAGPRLRALRPAIDPVNPIH